MSIIMLDNLYKLFFISGLMSYLLIWVFNVPFIYMGTVKSGYPELYKNLDNINSLALSAIGLFRKDVLFSLFMCKKII